MEYAVNFRTEFVVLELGYSRQRTATRRPCFVATFADTAVVVGAFVGGGVRAAATDPAMRDSARRTPDNSPIV